MEKAGFLITRLIYTAILPLPLIQEEQFSVNGERMYGMLSTGKLLPDGLPRNSVVRIMDHPDMTSAVYHGHKATNQTNKKSDLNRT